MKIMMVRSYDKILDEHKIKLAAEKNGKKYLGALWFELDDTDEIKEVFKSIELDDGADTIQIANAAYKLSYEYGTLAKDGSSWGCYAHWAWVNGLADKLSDWSEKEKISKLEKEKAEIDKILCSGEGTKKDFEMYDKVKAEFNKMIGM